MMKIYIVSILFSLLLIGCGSYNDSKSQEPTFTGAIVDSESWYSDMLDDVLNIRILIPEPNDYNCIPFDNITLPSRPCTLDDIIGDTNPYDTYEPLLHVRFQTDDFSVSNDVMNASFEQKGKSTRNARQKSFRIKLDSKTNLYKGERTFQLNKHPYDRSRVRNMLFFSLFREIPNFTSLKTKFVNLDINGDSYGLFTHIEKVGREFLLNRGWDKDDNLYKAQNFDFRYTDALALTDKGTPVNLDRFNLRIEIERGKEQTKLIEMLQAIDAARTDEAFEKVFTKYFNRENYITWMAVNLVVANKDTVSQNFYLLNPLNSDTFYFLPWDYDGTARDTVKYAKWERGIGTWWGIPLHNKFLNIKKNRDDLDTMVNEIYNNYINPSSVQAKLSIYRPLIEPYITVAPDSDNIDASIWETEFLSLPGRIDTNMDNYRGEIGEPMPFWQDFSYDKTSSVLTLKWDESIDFEGDTIIYDIKCADNYDFNNSIISRENMEVGIDLNITSYGAISYSQVVPSLQAGDKLIIQVIAKDKDNNASYQIAFDKSVDDANGNTIFGLLGVTIE